MKIPPVVHNHLYNEINSFVSRRVSNPEDVADLVQEIFLKLQVNFDSIEDQDRLVPWLYRVARNQIIDHYRKSRQKKYRVEEEAIEPEDQVFSEVSGWMRLFVVVMSEGDQEILELVEFQGLTQKEAASKLGIKPDAAKARHQRAKKRLRENLERCCRYSFDSNGRVIDYEIKGDDDCCG